MAPLATALGCVQALLIASILLVNADSGPGGGDPSAEALAFCAALTNPTDCFLATSPRCWWFVDGPAANTCKPFPLTRQPSAQRTPMPTTESNPCNKGEIECKQRAFCLWIPGDGCKLLNDIPRTPRPTRDGRSCLNLEEADCEANDDCVFIPGGIGCRPRPPRVVCPQADINNYRTCAVEIRERMAHALNETRRVLDDNHEDDENRTRVGREFFCDKARNFIVNATSRCVKSCLDEDNNFIGLEDNKVWCSKFYNNTALPDLFIKFNCTARPSCDEIIAQGIASNSDLQAALSVGGFAIATHASMFLVALLVGVVSMMMF